MRETAGQAALGRPVVGAVAEGVVTPAGGAATVRAARAVRQRRSTLVVLGLGVLVAVLVGAGLSLGAVRLGPGAVVEALTGRGPGSFVVLQLRAPRVVAGLLVGLAFGAAGAAFQSVLRNPLASPDILGISGGASAAGAAAILLAGWSGPQVAAAALAGALLVAGGVAAASWSRGLSGERFVLVGVAAALLVQAVTGYLLTRADVRDVPAALVWMVGSTGAARWPQLAVLTVACAVLLPALAVAGRRLPVLALGDDLARGLGVAPSPARIAVLGAAVGLIAVGTATTGPVAFVAFVAGPIARRATGTAGAGLGAAALTGAVLVLAADLVAQHLLGDLPVGVVTALVGGPVLWWLLSRGGGTRWGG
ncbi:MAG: iron ABC transporter permease [Actinobacteria bacterium]|nr:iron ABC transporter permease [Actinomycetota bacterium]